MPDRGGLRSSKVKVWSKECGAGHQFVANAHQQAPHIFIPHFFSTSMRSVLCNLAFDWLYLSKLELNECDTNFRVMWCAMSPSEIKAVGHLIIRPASSRYGLDEGSLGGKAAPACMSSACHERSYDALTRNEHSVSGSPF